MKPRIVWILGAVLSVAFAVTVADLCGEEVFEKCEEAYQEPMASAESPAEECKYWKEEARCGIDAAKDCELDPDVESEMNFLASFDCLHLADYRYEDLDCLESLNMSDLFQDTCLLSPTDLIRKAVDVMGRPEEISMDDLMCTLVSLILECFKGALTEQCGEASGELLGHVFSSGFQHFTHLIPDNVRVHLQNCNFNLDGTSGAVDDLDQDSLELSKRSDELELWYRKKRSPTFYYSPAKKRDTSTVYDPPAYRKRALTQYMKFKKRDMFGNRKKRGWRGNSYSWKQG